MLRLLAPLLLLATGLAFPAAWAEDPCDALSLDCPRPVVVVDEEKACAGVAGDHGGTAYCWFRARPHCVTRYFWNSYQETCLPLETLDRVFLA